MQEVYNGKTFPSFVASDETVAIVELQNKAGDTEYLYLPTDISSMNKVKERLQVQDYWEMEVTGIETFVYRISLYRCRKTLIVWKH